MKNSPVDNWTADDQRRVDTFTRDATAALITGEPHLLAVAVHGFIQAAGVAIENDLKARPQLARQVYWLHVIDMLRAHVAACAVVVAPPQPGPPH